MHAITNTENGIELKPVSISKKPSSKNPKPIILGVEETKEVIKKEIDFCNRHCRLVDISELPHLHLI